MQSPDPESGKTHLLTEIVKTVPHKSGMYLAYNKSIAMEAAGKFPRSISCLTTHSLAYKAVVRLFGLRVGSFSYKDIKESMPYEAKLDLIDLVKEFCLSRYVEFKDFAKEAGLTPTKIKQCETYLERMYTGSIECTHDFYLKVFHIHLADKSIEYPLQDIIMVDEAGDLNAVTLEIFKLLPAKVKIAAGDNCQNVYGFNHTINAFEEIKNGVRFNLTQSFRVSSDIAERIERFCQEHLDPTMQFKGLEKVDNTITTRAILSRTNSALVAEIINLMHAGIEFGMVRSPVELFKLPLALCFAKYQGTISDPEYKHLQSDIDDWFESTDLQTEFKSVLSYLAAMYSFDVGLMSAINLLMTFSKKDIFDAYEFAKSNYGKKSNLCLATVHSTKGLEWDEVTILNDFNTKLQKIKNGETGKMSEEDILQEFNLYYVGCSRAKKSLLNAVHL